MFLLRYLSIVVVLLLVVVDFAFVGNGLEFLAEPVEDQQDDEVGNIHMESADPNLVHEELQLKHD